ncbi:Ig-specific serine endopeptidase MIP [Mycoplasmopsis meleagridis]|uniref:Ig-specific serine endopeptidase MIP n=1 Tax=Mycoplasmopsis meleagridis TaxID=29561 RepID=UPI003A8B2D4A
MKNKKWLLLSNLFLGGAIIPFAASCNNTNNTNDDNSPTYKDSEEKDPANNDNNTDNNTQNNSSSAAGKEGSVEVEDYGPTPVFPGTQSTSSVRLNIPGKPELANDKEKWSKLSKEEKTKAELDAYVDDLQSNFGTYQDKLKNSKLTDLPRLDAAQIQKYDEKAAQAGQPTFESAIARNFSVANEDGTITLNPIRDSVKAAYWDSVPNNRGLARNLPNQKYKDVALQSYAIEFVNMNEKIRDEVKDNKYIKIFKGTAWLLDWELDDSGYPTKWFLATNAHVAAGFITENSTGLRYTNQNDLEKEAQNHKKYLDQYNEAQKAFDQMAVEYDDKIRAANDEIAGYEAKLRIAETNQDPAEVDKYNKLLDQVKLGDLKSAIDAKNKMAEEKWYPIYGKQWNEAKAHLNDFVGATRTIFLSHLNDSVPIDQDLKVMGLDNSVDRYELKPSQVKLIYAGVDFLNSSPKDYLKSTSSLSNVQEAADFVVIEIDFNNPNGVTSYSYTNNRTKQHVVKDAHELAKAATNGYATWDKSRQFKFASKTLSQTYSNLINEKVKVRTTDNREVSVSKADVDFISLGFPDSKSDNFIKKTYSNDDYINESSQSLWVNKPYYIADYNRTEGRVFTKELGGGLNKAYSIRNDVNTPGIFNLTLVSPVIYAEKNEGYKFNFIKDTESSYKGDTYTNYGLAYSLNSWAPLGGASGSSFRDVDNNILGINFAIADGNGIAQTAYIQAFRSNGNDYNNFYGKYKLEEYDLIYGTGKDQRTSYRQALESYNPNIKTHLFPNGVSLANVPTEYKFADTPTSSK